MRQSADQPMRGPAWQLRVGIERDHVADARQNREIPNLDREVVRVLTQQVVEVEQFPALALPTHPGAFARVEDPVPVEKEERTPALTFVLVVQAFDQS